MNTDMPADNNIFWVEFLSTLSDEDKKISKEDLLPKYVEWRRNQTTWFSDDPRRDKGNNDDEILERIRARREGKNNLTLDDPISVGKEPPNPNVVWLQADREQHPYRLETPASKEDILKAFAWLGLDAWADE